LGRGIVLWLYLKIALPPFASTNEVNHFVKAALANPVDSSRSELTMQEEINTDTVSN